MYIDHHLTEQLKALRLGGFLQSLDLRVKQAQELDYLSSLQLMVQDEIERREAKKLSQRPSRACFEEQKTLEDFDFPFNPKIKRSLLRNLAKWVLIEKKEHVLIYYGPAEVGKTHMPQTLGQEACRRGHELLFLKSVKMLRSLHAARLVIDIPSACHKYASAVDPPGVEASLCCAEQRGASCLALR